MTFSYKKSLKSSKDILFIGIKKFEQFNKKCMKGEKLDKNLECFRMWNEKSNKEPTSPFFDIDLGADVTDLDNSTYFETVKALLTPEIRKSW